MRERIERELARWDAALASRLAEILCLGDGCGPHLRKALAVLEEVCRLPDAAPELLGPPEELITRARTAGVDSQSLWKVLNTPETSKKERERAKAKELIEAARRDRRKDIEEALLLMAKDDYVTGVWSDGSEEARLHCELAAMEPGEQSNAAREQLERVKAEAAETEARLMALRLEDGAAKDTDSICEPFPEDSLRVWLAHWRRPATWKSGIGGPSAENLRRILSMSRQAISAAARRGRWNKSTRGRDKPLKPGQLANVLRRYSEGGGQLAVEARRTAETLAGMSARLRE